MPQQQAVSTAGAVYKRLWGYTRKYWLMFVIGVLGVSLDAGMQAMFIGFVEPLIDRVFVEKDAAYGTWLAVGVMGVVLLRIIGHFAGAYGMEWTGRRVVADLRKELFASYLHLPATFYDRNSPGQLISKLAYNSEQVAHAATKAVISAFRDILLLIYLVILMLSTNARLTAVLLILVPVVSLVVTVISRKFRKISRNIQNSMGDVAHVTEEAVIGQRVVKVFLGQDTEKERFERVNERTRRLHMRMVATHMLSSSIVQFAAGIALVSLMLIATRPAMLSTITAGTFTAIFFAMIATIPPLKRLTNVQSQMQKGIAAADSIFVVIDAEKEQDNGTRRVDRAKGEIEFRDVVFQYDNSHKPVLDNISLHFPAGSVTAVVGQSGSGKTTLAGLLPRFYTYNQGNILLDGFELTDYELNNLRKQISLVSQDVVLFNDTIAGNIAYGALEGIDRDAIIRAATAAHAMEFIEQLPEGLDTVLGETGTLLSGGQRQRLAIARALLKDAPILILDEATSALDSESERAIQIALKEVMKGRTTLVIAHRLSTIENADQVIVLGAGQVIEQGTHTELLERGEAYARLYHTQFEIQGRVVD
ncbi:MAG: lipid A export permease/ATP-binding protein MsbA [Xanthomonadales bacterium]|nr:lipid A export permease/ATP-binding protein MsbA [Xanthomonadales bacterium]MDH4018271.1 lipid A export permease/ATP-binding protein MsbA [Xanthomonadales bacterium]